MAERKHFYFLIERSSKLLRGSSWLPRLDVLRVKLGGLLSYNARVVEGRLLLVVSRPVRVSLWSADELGLFDEKRAFLELLPYRAELITFSCSRCWWHKIKQTIQKCFNNKLRICTQTFRKDKSRVQMSKSYRFSNSCTQNRIKLLKGKFQVKIHLFHFFFLKKERENYHILMLLYILKHPLLSLISPWTRIGGVSPGECFNRARKFLSRIFPNWKMQLQEQDYAVRNSWDIKYFHERDEQKDNIV